MRDTLDIGRTPQSALPRFPPIVDGGIGEACLSKVMRQNLRLGSNGFRELALEHLADAGVQLLPLPAQEAAIGCVLHKGVLEDKRFLRRNAAPKDEFRADQLLERVAKLPLRAPRERGDQVVGEFAADRRT